MSVMTPKTMLDAPLSVFFARFIAQQGGESMDSVLAKSAACLADIQMQGHVCLNLSEWAEKPWPDIFGHSPRENTPNLEQWRKLLLSSICVEEAGGCAPMILDGHQLYLHRFWQYENTVADLLNARLQATSKLDETKLQQGLQRLFHSHSNAEVDWQMLAAALALTRQFTVISGGPGTGKTTSLVKVLALLLEQQADMTIRLAAPTGKAAARMMESIALAKASIDVDEQVRSNIPDQASTLHRLLGYSPRGYRFNKQQPLMLDCLVVDEASMIDLPMMARLLEALPPHARIILLGDRDQLSSVDAGNVLGDITGHGHEIAYSSQMIKQLSNLTQVDSELLPLHQQAPSIADSIALLRTSYRFKADRGIGRLAACVNAGDVAAAMDMLMHQDIDELTWLTHTKISQFLDDIADLYAVYLQQQDVEKAMGLFEIQRVLCAVRHGLLGVDAINQGIALRLQHKGLMKQGQLVQGLPIMVTANNYELHVFNGDIAMLWRNDQGQLRAYFRQENNTLRDIPAQSLPQYEWAWAMTVHKSQGSEFQQVILVLPEDAGQVLNRELLYTAITRTRQRFTLYGQRQVLEQGIQQTVNRSTGLSARLQWSS